MLIPPVRKTWSPRGQTPIVAHHERHDRISAISGISISPVKKRLGLYYSLYKGNVTQVQVCDFLRYLLRHLRGFVIVVWDNASPHKGRQIRDFCGQCKRLHLEALPPYAPELNPDEGVWSQAKESMANGRPDNMGELWWDVLDILDSLTASQSSLRACIHKSELPLLLP